MYTSMSPQITQQNDKAVTKISRLEHQKYNSILDSTGGAYSTPPDPVAGGPQAAAFRALPTPFRIIPTLPDTV